MKNKSIGNFVFIVVAAASILLLPPRADAFMPCCSDLNCEWNFDGCVYDCSYFHAGDEACMDNCLAEAHACQQTWCS